MIRRPADLEARPFDVVVVGGGVLGAFTAWDSALRGLTVALVEGEDFGGGTTANSLRIVHGGLRYLPRLDLPRMRASSRERAAWLRIAPHLVEPLPVLAPFHRRGPVRGLFRRGGVATANLLSWDRNRGVPGELAVPPARLLGSRECVDRVPQLEDRLPAGGILFHDAIVRSPERLVLEVVKAAVQAGAVAANHVSCQGALIHSGNRIGITARDHVSGETLKVRGRVIVNCTGPGAGDLSERLTGRPVARRSVPSLALNLVLPGDRTSTALALHADGRRLLRVPWRDRILVGTLHRSGAPASLPSSPDHPAVAELLSEFNGAWPGPPVEPDDVLAVHAGLLPARRGGDRDGRGPVQLTRRSQIRVLEGGEGSPVIEAGTLNFTLARRVAESVTDRLCSVLDHSSPPSLTHRTLLPGASAAQISTLEATVLRDWGEALPEGLPGRLVRTYGATYGEVTAHLDGDPEASRRIAPGVPAIRAQLRHGVTSEMACTPHDLLDRRIGLGHGARVPEEARQAAARELADATASPDRTASRELVRVQEAAEEASPPPDQTSRPATAPGGTIPGGGAAREPLATWLVDGHAHLHSCFGWNEVLDAVTQNLAQAASDGGPSLEAACLLLAEAGGGATAGGSAMDGSSAEEPRPGRSSEGGSSEGASPARMDQSPRIVERLRDPVEAVGLLPPEWRAEPTAEEGSVRLASEGGGPPIFLVDGRQLVTAEGVEVLALCSREAHAELDGLPLSQTIEGIRAIGGIPVLPWGFGKWWGRRGRLVRELVERLGGDHEPGGGPSGGPPLFLGDNGNRAAGTPRPSLMRQAEERGIPVLPGSDPLPFSRHAGRAASTGFRLTGPLDPERPLSSVRWTLRTLTGSPPPYGRGASPLQFVRDQLGMQLRKRRGGRGAAAGGAS